MSTLLINAFRGNSNVIEILMNARLQARAALAVRFHIIPPYGITGEKKKVLPGSKKL